ncbi:glycine zipper 2TM domain-containing protein [uncultured Sphingomonas sp.]|uniref:glycine zipper 2TM domain-containing protein n=1 Tax=uncultured Sphingomonas sp. TaxID=158754 RepID=UPI0035C96863
MFKSLSLAAAALTMTAGALVPATADAQYRGRDRGYSQYDRGYDDRYEGRQYRDRRSYSRRAQGRCRSGDTGTLVGAIAGGLLGRTIDTRGDRLLGTVLGAGGGALAGRAIERSSDCGRR